MRVEDKMFYFDIGQNRRGVFMRLSEVNKVLSLHVHLLMLIMNVCDIIMRGLSKFNSLI